MDARNERYLHMRFFWVGGNRVVLCFWRDGVAWTSSGDDDHHHHFLDGGIAEQDRRHHAFVWLYFRLHLKVRRV